MNSYYGKGDQNKGSCNCDGGGNFDDNNDRCMWFMISSYYNDNVDGNDDHERQFMINSHYCGNGGGHCNKGNSDDTWDENDLTTNERDDRHDGDDSTNINEDGNGDHYDKHSKDDGSDDGDHSHGIYEIKEKK